VLLLLLLLLLMMMMMMMMMSTCIIITCTAAHVYLSAVSALFVCRLVGGVPRHPGRKAEVVRKRHPSGGRLTAPRY